MNKIHNQYQHLTDEEKLQMSQAITSGLQENWQNKALSTSFSTFKTTSDVTSSDLESSHTSARECSETTNITLSVLEVDS